MIASPSFMHLIMSSTCLSGARGLAVSVDGRPMPSYDLDLVIFALLGASLISRDLSVSFPRAHQEVALRHRGGPAG